MNGAPLFCVCNCDNYKFLWDITVNKKYYQLGRPNIKHNTPAPAAWIQENTKISIIYILKCAITPLIESRLDKAVEIIFQEIILFNKHSGQ